MKADIAKLWVDALRSGKYHQSRGALKNKDGYCCLGVLCEVVGLKFENIERCDDEGGTQNIFVCLDESDLPPKEVCAITGMKTRDGSFLSGDEISVDGELFSSLAIANDHGKSFPQIATFIEQNYESL